MPKPDADLWMRVDLPLDKKTVENQDWAAGPSRAVGRGPLGLRAFGPLGRGPAFSKTPSRKWGEYVAESFHGNISTH